MLMLLCTAAGVRLRLAALIPDTFTISPGEELSIASMPYISARPPEGEMQVAGMQSGSSYNVQLLLFDTLPVKTVRAQVTGRREVTVCGSPFGIKMFSAGVMVVGFSDICGEAGYCNPAKDAGLVLGDYVTAVGGVKIRTNEQLRDLVQQSGGAPLAVNYTHAGTAKTTTLHPVKDTLSGSWRTGMWVRDSSAGIGTLTFVDGGSGVFGGLGHSVTDVDTGESLTLATGEIVPVEITGAVPGTVGVPGELKGRFVSDAKAMGSIRVNGESGVYGVAYDKIMGVSMETAQMQEITTGPAQILTTIDGRGVRAYDIQIERLTYNADDPNKNMLIRVTDEQLLGATGGIVQGMSGSPILQDGKLIGAVTHVLVNSPDTGYGIFIENMLDAAG